VGLKRLREEEEETEWFIDDFSLGKPDGHSL